MVSVPAMPPSLYCTVYMAKYTLEIFHVAGEDNIVAKSLSRPLAVAPQPTVIAAEVLPA